MADLVTNADDVEVVIDSYEAPTDSIETPVRIKANEFTISVEQDINSVGAISQNTPKGLTKGDLEYSFEFSIEGDDVDIQALVSGVQGDSYPFDMAARKPTTGEADIQYEWEYSLETCLADTEEITGTTGEALGFSVEGMAAGLDK